MSDYLQKGEELRNAVARLLPDDPPEERMCKLAVALGLEIGKAAFPHGAQLMLTRFGVIVGMAAGCAVNVEEIKQNCKGSA